MYRAWKNNVTAISSDVFFRIGEVNEKNGIYVKNELRLESFLKVFRLPGDNGDAVDRVGAR